MSEEEKKAIEYLKNRLEILHNNTQWATEKSIKVVLDLIEKQQKELEGDDDNMDLWIKSQNGERIGKIDYIEYAEDDYGYYLIGWKDKFEGTKIATYKTKERCLEVLEHIWKKMGIYSTANLMLVKYEMPKE